MTLLMSCRSSPSHQQLKNEEELYTLKVTEEKKKEGEEEKKKSEIVQSNFFIKADWNNICGENLYLIISL